MTDLEISKALALAIGWKPEKVLPYIENPGLKRCWVYTGKEWRVFDYRAPDVIWPIAKATNNFPSMVAGGLWCSGWSGPSADTPEKAVALSVIGGAA